MNVSGIERCPIEGWREEQNQLVIAADELLVHRRHRGRGVSGLRGAGDHTPRLRDRIDSTFGARGRTERRSIVEVGPPVPGAVPAVLLERLPERGDVPSPFCATRLLMLIAAIRQLSERR